MKKNIGLIILFVLTLLCMVCLLSSCGGSEQPSDSTSYIKSIDSWYETAEDGTRVLVLDITYFNDTKEVIKTNAPKELVDLSLTTNVFALVPRGQEAPQLQAHLVFADGTVEDIPVTPQMIKGGAIDFSTVGTYTIVIEHMGKRVSSEVYVRSGIMVNGEIVESDKILDALKAGGDITLAGDFKVALTEDLVFDKETVLDLNGFTLSFVGGKYLRVLNNVTVKNGTLISDTNGFLVGKRSAEGVTPVVGNLTIESGNYRCPTTIAQATNGTVTIKGGCFTVDPWDDGVGGDGYRYTMNCYDASYRDGTAKVIIEGGTFYKWNPQNNTAEGADTNFVKEGYISNYVVIDGAEAYTVVPAPAVTQ